MTVVKLPPTGLYKYPTPSMNEIYPFLCKLSLSLKTLTLSLSTPVLVPSSQDLVLSWYQSWRAKEDQEDQSSSHGKSILRSRRSRNFKKQTSQEIQKEINDHPTGRKACKQETVSIQSRKARNSPEIPTLLEWRKKQPRTPCWQHQLGEIQPYQPTGGLPIFLRSQSAMCLMVITFFSGRELSKQH